MEFRGLILTSFLDHASVEHTRYFNGISGHGVPAA